MHWRYTALHSGRAKVKDDSQLEECLQLITKRSSLSACNRKLPQGGGFLSGPKVQSDSKFGGMSLRRFYRVKLLLHDKLVSLCNQVHNAEQSSTLQPAILVYPAHSFQGVDNNADACTKPPFYIAQPQCNAQCACFSCTAGTPSPSACPGLQISSAAAGAMHLLRGNARIQAIRSLPDYRIRSCS